MSSFTDYQQLYKLTILNDENKQHKASNVFQKFFFLINNANIQYFRDPI